MKTREELIKKAGQFYANPDIKYPTDVLQLFTLMADFALSLEGTCKWKQPPLCDWHFPLCLDGEPYQIYDNITFNYCPFCGKKIERI